MNALIDRARRDVGLPYGKTTRPFISVALSDHMVRQAEIILLNHRLDAIGSNDALHVAVIKELQKTYPDIVITSDNSLQNVCTKNGIGFYDPEISV